jgi:uncharacterized protein
LVFATPAEVAAFWHAISIADAKRWLENASDDVEVVEIGARKAYALRGWDRRRVRSAPDRIRFLSPFDPIVHDRRRAERYFEFEYRFEAFVPEPKRKYGYYVLPMLEGDRLVGRINPKMHREQELLEVRGVWWEPAFKPTRARRARFDEALERFASQLGARKIKRSRG